MVRLNCLRCVYRNGDTGDCTATGGSCTTVPAAHCRLLQEYLDTGLTAGEVNKVRADIEAGYMKSIARAYGIDVERLKELSRADREDRVVELPCKVGDTVIYQTFAENPALMKNIRLEIAYESRCGIIFHMGYGIFADLVERGQIKPVSEEAKESLRRAENG